MPPDLDVWRRCRVLRHSWLGQPGGLKLHRAALPIWPVGFRSGLQIPASDQSLRREGGFWLRGGFCAAENERRKHFVLCRAISAWGCTRHAGRRPCAGSAAQSRGILSRTLGPAPRTWPCPSVRLRSGLRRRPGRRPAAAEEGADRRSDTVSVACGMSLGRRVQGAGRSERQRAGSHRPHAPPGRGAGAGGAASGAWRGLGCRRQLGGKEAARGRKRSDRCLRGGRRSRAAPVATDGRSRAVRRPVAGPADLGGVSSAGSAGRCPSPDRGRGGDPDSATSSRRWPRGACGRSTG